MRICVIFNPAAKGDKARRFQRHLDEIGAQSGLKLTSGPGHARRLAAEAVAEGYSSGEGAAGWTSWFRASATLRQRRCVRKGCPPGETEWTAKRKGFVPKENLRVVWFPVARPAK